MGWKRIFSADVWMEWDLKVSIALHPMEQSDHWLFCLVSSTKYFLLLRWISLDHKSEESNLQIQNILVCYLRMKYWHLSQAFSWECAPKNWYSYFPTETCCGYSKEPSQWEGSFELSKHMLKLMAKKIFTILDSNFVYYLNLSSEFPYFSGWHC